MRIERLGAQGDGVAVGPDGPLYVPFALPGELVRVRATPGEERADLLSVSAPSPERAAPICRYFGECGGCTLQHLEKDAYLAWKRDQVVAAFAARGIEAPVEAVRPVPIASRRRATFALTGTPQRATLGYRAARSHALVPIDSCPILTARIEAALPKLGLALSSLAGKSDIRVTVTDTDMGLDVAVDGVRASPALVGRLAFAASGLGVARLTLESETAALFAEPVVTLSGARVKLPPGTFMQATAEAEAIMVALVMEGIGKAKRVADLFAGIGTFTFALAKSSEVDAFEEDEAALHALGEAARTTPKLKPIATHRRDLFRVPLTSRELARYDAVALDPPRAGAKAQAEALAASKVPRIVMVSCNPATCARDARILIDGGYRLARIVPVDQFLFSSHIELVCWFKR